MKYVIPYIHIKHDSEKYLETQSIDNKIRTEDLNSHGSYERFGDF